MHRPLLLVAGLVAACDPASGDPPADDTDDTDTIAPSAYDDDARWACLPGKPDDVCARDLSARVLAPDGTEAVETPPRAEAPAFDCFYVYPTVDLYSGGRDTDFSEPGARLDPLLGQAAPFTRHCAVFAPYYGQAALNAFGEPGVLDAAYADVRDAFRQFVARRSSGRPFALVGHSQGTRHLVKLLAEEIEPDDALHDRLVVAVLLGGTITTPAGADVGGTFTRTPVCTARGQRGCVLAWVTYAADDPPGEDDLFGWAPEGSVHACTDPRALAGDAPRVGGSWFATQAYGPAFTNPANPWGDLDEPFVRYPDAFTSACRTEGAATWLEIAYAPPEDDARTPPPWRNGIHESIGFGMHGIDFGIVLDDLLDVVGAITP